VLINRTVQFAKNDNFTLKWIAISVSAILYFGPKFLTFRDDVPFLLQNEPNSDQHKNHLRKALTTVVEIRLKNTFKIHDLTSLFLTVNC
jgi:hypothetical protein